MTGSLRIGLEVLAWLALVALLIAAVPVFLCMPLWADVTHYDLCARNVLQGGVHYRDVFDTNLPGMVWLHMAVRSALGYRSEALRLTDIFVYAGIVWLLVRWVQHFRLSRTARLCLAVTLFAFYFSTSEWCHCQRDTWMLLPALGALDFRCRQTLALAEPKPDIRHALFRGVLEGLLWGMAFWIKPFVALPALACWLLSAIWLCGQRPAAARVIVLDAASVLTGGLLIGGAGVIWLLTSGAWPYFLDVFQHWNPEYYTQNPFGIGLRTEKLLTRLPPWGFIHLAAVPMALAGVGRVLMRSWRRLDTMPLSFQEALMSVMYLAWLVQAAYLQKVYDYVPVPAVPLAVTVIAGRTPSLNRSYAWRPVLVVFALVALFLHPLFFRWPTGSFVDWPFAGVTWRIPLPRWGNLSLWDRCLREGSTAELRDRLQLTTTSNTTDWTDLEKVASYLRDQLHARDGEVTCYHNTTHPLYLELNLRPSLRYMHFHTVLHNFPSHREDIRRELQECGHKYIVSDLRSAGLTEAEAEDESRGWLVLPAKLERGPWADVYPWQERIIYRAGRYVVHEARSRGEPIGKLWPD